MLSGEISSETYSFTKEILIDIDKEVGEDTPVNMDQDRGVDSLPIGPLVRLRGLPIEVPQNLHAVDMPSYLPKFYGTKDEDPSKDNKGHIERLASSLVTNPEYWLVWFPTTLEGEAYEWYRDHAADHFRKWEQLQR